MRSNPDHRHATWRAAGWAGTVLLLTLATTALLVGACGDDDGAETATEEGTAATTTAGPDRPDSRDGDALLGTWVSPNAREMSFTADGDFSVTESGEVLAVGTYTATSTTVELVPGSGAIACAESGTYEWDVEDDILTFTVVNDPCDGRKEGLDGVPRKRVDPGKSHEAGPVAMGEPGNVSAGDTVETPRVGGLRFVVPEDRFIYQAPGLVSVDHGGLPAYTDFVSVVETLRGEPIDSVDTVVTLIAEASLTLEEVESTTIAGYQARVFDFTAEKEGEPRPDDAVFRFEAGGIGGWGPIGAGRVWLLDTPRGILLLSGGTFQPDVVDVQNAIAEAEAILATLELIDGAS